MECLNCGQVRLHVGDECPRCAYVGWAYARDLDEPLRRALRERPPARRRLRVVA